jgi:hypothetical protein
VNEIEVLSVHHNPLQYSGDSTHDDETHFVMGEDLNQSKEAVFQLASRFPRADAFPPKPEDTRADFREGLRESAFDRRRWHRSLREPGWCPPNRSRHQVYQILQPTTIARRTPGESEPRQVAGLPPLEHDLPEPVVHYAVARARDRTELAFEIVQLSRIEQVRKQPQSFCGAIVVAQEIALFGFHTECALSPGQSGTSGNFQLLCDQIKARAAMFPFALGFSG